MQVERQAFHEPEEILQNVREKVAKAKETGEFVDYLAFVPDGEPTLDANLGREIALLRSLEIKIAVITNSSLVWRDDVRKDLAKADWVSLKVDATREEVWRQIDRPHGTLQLAAILDGVRKFADAYGGDLTTETMLVTGINDDDACVAQVADFLAQLQPAVSYLSVPTRPPAEKWVRSPGEDVVNRAYQIFDERVERVEVLTGYEGDAFAFTGRVEEDLLSITAVHPMREQAVNDFLARANADWSVVHGLVARGQLVETEYDGRKFYLRKLFRKGTDGG
jgi:wyosine [tRNA(Phe)-imidazoG37] synthetase (radical SAM superfamily)